jgi:peptidoglycan/LPS O-acetylase OafA/YrhL
MSAGPPPPRDQASGFEAGRYLPVVDGLRALSILAVLLYHDDSLLQGGFLGVDVFFVLSGFLITSLLFDEWRRHERIDLRAFYLRRALRLFPALFLLLAVSAAFALAFPSASQSPHLLDGVKYSLLYVSNWASSGDPMRFGPLGHTWSLSVEEQFYAIWPVLLIGLLALTRGKRSLAVGIALLAVASAAWRALLFTWGSTPWRLYTGTDSRADSLFVGAAVAIAMVGGYLPRVRRPALARAVALLAAGVLTALMFTTRLEWPVYYQGGFLLVSVAVGVLLVVLLSDPNWALARLLSARPIVWVGRLSYSLYLWHYPIFGFVKADRLGLGVRTVEVLRLVLAFGAAVGSYYLVERPLLRWKKSIGARRAAPAGAAAVTVTASAARLR